MSTMRMKHLSSVANDVVQACAVRLNTSVDKLVEEFEATSSGNDETATSLGGRGGGVGTYTRKFLEFCSAKGVRELSQNNIEQKIADGIFSRFTFDMMLAWEIPDSAQEDSFTECEGKEKEDRKVVANFAAEQEDVSLFYTDLMPLLVDNERSVGEDAFVWLGSLVPLVTDIVNGRFTFETLTAPTGNRLHFPAYDKYIKEIDKCIKHLQKQAKPKGVEFADDEFILHVEGTASTQRVVRHIGGTSWPGKLTLTNYALYFEASGVITYEDALKIDLSKDREQSVKSASTGPWGAPLFDKAIVYESPELSEGVVLEFPEITSSTRRDHWLAVTKEIMLMHQFLSKFKLECPLQAWEMHARTILSIIRLHAAREMLRISPPKPTRFLIFSLSEELPKGDYILEELAESLKKVNSGHPCSASSILRSMIITESIHSSVEVTEVAKERAGPSGPGEDTSLLENVISQAREEEKEIVIAKASAEGLKEEGITESTTIFMELLKPIGNVWPGFEEVLTWERPAITLTVISVALVVTYEEWVGKAIAAFLVWVVAKMIRARQERIDEKCNELVVYTASEQTTVENIVSAQHGMQTVHEVVKKANVSVLKLWSIFISKAHKHANTAMVVLIAASILLAVVPIKVFIMGALLSYFTMTLVSKVGKSKENNQGFHRRLKEWWDSIPVIPVRVVDEVPNSPNRMKWIGVEAER
ncbi:uncharacterized protein LOC126804378 [Argentina anserina]|uniref:uncharacterized protein LOC126804378 n=1 Tax=Argentina anserina TaxID=57926 RepID=UPI00217667EA|nr:uncharacterized protein LOC126804378 [Potentilla anserina]